MLPSEFPVEEGRPEIVTYILASDDGLYEISLDYGVDCRGAGVCRFGSAAGCRARAESSLWFPGPASLWSRTGGWSRFVDR